MKTYQFLLISVVLLVSCQPTSQPINYGEDECVHCKMSIVDAPFAAELVTKKGKVFKFDAIECMMAYLREQTEKEFSMYLVHDLNIPTDWQDATQCKYLVSKDLPSPMGGNLSAYSTNEGAENMQLSKGGEIYDWAGLAILFEK